MDNIQKHRHNGIDAAQIYAEDLIGRSVITANFQVSARAGQPTVLEHGNYTLAANVKFVAFPQAYSTTTGLQVLLTPDTVNQQFLQGIVVSGFTVSGSGADTGRWLSIGWQ